MAALITNLGLEKMMITLHPDYNFQIRYIWITDNEDPISVSDTVSTFRESSDAFIGKKVLPEAIYKNGKKLYIPVSIGPTNKTFTWKKIGLVGTVTDSDRSTFVLLAEKEVDYPGKTLTNVVRVVFVLEGANG